MIIRGGDAGTYKISCSTSFQRLEVVENDLNMMIMSYFVHSIKENKTYPMNLNEDITI